MQNRADSSRSQAAGTHAPCQRRAKPLRLSSTMRWNVQLRDAGQSRYLIRPQRHDSVMSEIELKFLIDEPGSRRLRARVRALHLAKAAPHTRLVRSIYLDTPEWSLRKAGISLRLRRDGRRWLQTVKAGRQLHGGLSDVTEIENPAPGGHLALQSIPDVALR